MRKPMPSDCNDGNGVDWECYDDAMGTYEDTAYEEARDRKMEEELEEFEKVAGMNYFKAKVIFKDTLNCYDKSSKKMSEIIDDIKNNGYTAIPF